MYKIKAAITECHRLSDLNSRNLFLRALEAAQFKIKTVADPVSGDSTLAGLQMVILLHPYVA